MRILSVIPLLTLPSPLCEFDYILPPQEILPAEGSIVLVPFRGKLIPGVVTKLKHRSSLPVRRLKTIKKILVSFSLVPALYVRAFEEVSIYYHISLPSALKVWLPKIPHRSAISQRESQKGNHTIIPLQTIGRPVFFEYESQEKVIELYQQKTEESLKRHEPVLILAPTKAQVICLRKELQKHFPPFLFRGELQKSVQKNFHEFLEYFEGHPLIHIGTRKMSLWYSKMPHTFIIHNILDKNFKQYDQGPRYEVFTLLDLTQKFCPSRKIIATHPFPSLSLLEKIQKGSWNHEKIKRTRDPNIQFFDLGKERENLESPLTKRGGMMIQEALREKKRVLLWCDKKDTIYLKKYFHSPDLFIVSQFSWKNISFSSFQIVGIINFDLLCLPLFYDTWEQACINLHTLLSYLSEHGIFFIQGFSPDHPVLKHFLRGESTKFFNKEALVRSSLKLPPFSKLIKIQISKGLKTKFFVKNLKEFFENVFVYTQFFSKKNSIRDSMIILLCLTSTEEEEKLFSLLENSSLKYTFDINPISLV